VSNRNQKTLFIFSNLAKRDISLRSIRDGTEALSGTDTSCLLVADGLASRGHSIGIWVRAGAHVATQARQFDSQKSALEWIEDGRIILCTWQQDVFQARMPFRCHPWVWTQLPISQTEFKMVECGTVDGVVAVSDTIRLPFLHSPAHRRIGRVYNPLNPYFGQPATYGKDRYQQRRVAFAGYIGESKGVHRLFQIWGHVRQQIPDARLTVAGSHKLYDEQRKTGSFGIAHPEFEARYIAPLADQFGGIAEAGIEFVGLQSAHGLRNLYLNSALGVVNPNWSEYTETFCCAAVEMLAAGLPVFSSAAGALPETIGRSGGAVLARTPDIAHTGAELARLLVDGPRLHRLGTNGRNFVASSYNLEAILDCWEQLLQVPTNQLHRATGAWRGPRGTRFWAERCARIVGMGKPFRWAVELSKKLAKK
jgi:glycosyltransferase involved in cell wall biosynthesis